MATDSLIDQPSRRVTVRQITGAPTDVPGVATVGAHDVRAGGARLHYLVSGTGPPLVLVHGLSGSSRWWIRNIEALAAGRRVYALDLVGFGRSWPKHHFSLDWAMDSLLAWMDALGLPQADFCGHSMGGQLCMRLAATHPARVGRLVLVNASGLPLNASPLRLAWRCVRSSGQSRFRFAPTVVRTSLQAGPLVLWGASRSILGDNIVTTAAHIRAPTFIICGGCDVLVPLTLGHTLREVIPGSRLTVIADAGHNVMYDCASSFNQLVLEFLRTTQQATPSVGLW